MAAAANLVVAVVYVGIAVFIVRPLARQGRLQTSPLATATALIFASAGLHHGIHVLELLLPSVGLDENVGRATREVFGWPLAVSDLFAAAVGVYYLRLRRTYGMQPRSGELFTDTRRQQQEALDLNDTVVQGLVAAQLARRLGRERELDEALAVSLESARGMVDRLLSEVESTNPAKSGRFVRREPTRLRRP